MDFLKAFFTEKSADKSWEAFEKWAKEKGFEIADVKGGGYEREEEIERKLRAQGERLKSEYEAKIAGLQKGGEKKPEDAVAEELAECKRRLEELRKESEESKKKSAWSEARALYVEAGGSLKNAERDVSWLFGKASAEKPFADLLASYKKENPEVFEAKPQEKGGLSTVPNVKGGDEARKAEEEAEARSREILGLKKKEGGVGHAKRIDSRGRVPRADV
jgi:hypothetical protein